MSAAAEIAAKLRGQTLSLPNLQGFFSRWPSGISPYYGLLAEIVEEKIQEWITDEHVRIKARKVNLPLFSATHVPSSPLILTHSLLTQVQLVASSLLGSPRDHVVLLYVAIPMGRCDRGQRHAARRRG